MEAGRASPSSCAGSATKRETYPARAAPPLARDLRTYEQRNVTFLADDFPIFWESARGATVTDVDGNRYIDCTAAFGVANAGHCNPQVISSIVEAIEAPHARHGRRSSDVRSACGSSSAWRRSCRAV